MMYVPVVTWGVLWEQHLWVHEGSGAGRGELVLCCSHSRDLGQPQGTWDGPSELAPLGQELSESPSDPGCRSGAGSPSEPGGLQGATRHLKECGQTTSSPGHSWFAQEPANRAVVWEPALGAAPVMSVWPSLHSFLCQLLALQKLSSLHRRLQNLLSKKCTRAPIYIAPLTMTSCY